MLDIIVSGGTVGPSLRSRAGRYRRQRPAYCRDRRARQPRRDRRRTDRRRGGPDRHPRRHRPACPLQLADADARRRPADPDRAGLAGQPRGLARRHDDDDRLRPGRGRRDDPAGDRTAPQAVGRRLLRRLRLSHDAARQDRARAPRRTRRGGAGRACLGQDVHDRHHARAATAAWSISAISGRC